MELPLEKPNVKEERQAKKDARAHSRIEASIHCKALDGYLCRNLACVRNRRRGEYHVDACHIIPKRPNAPWLDHPKNLITLCRECHEMFDGQRPPMNDKGEEMTVLRFRLWVLGMLKASGCYFRWGEKHENPINDHEHMTAWEWIVRRDDARR